MHVRRCLRMHVCMYICMYACMYVCMYGCICVWLIVCLYNCLGLRLYLRPRLVSWGWLGRVHWPRRRARHGRDKEFAEASAFPLYLTIPQTSLPSRAADSSGEEMAALGGGEYWASGL